MDSPLIGWFCTALHPSSSWKSKSHVGLCRGRRRTGLAPCRGWSQLDSDGADAAPQGDCRGCIPLVFLDGCKRRLGLSSSGAGHGVSNGCEGKVRAVKGAPKESQPCCKSQPCTSCDSQLQVMPLTTRKAPSPPLPFFHLVWAHRGNEEFIQVCHHQEGFVKVAHDQHGMVPESHWGGCK